MPKTTLVVNELSMEEAAELAAAHDARIANGGFRLGDAGTPGAFEAREAEAILAYARLQATAATYH